MKKQFTAIDLFSGVGGISLGLSQVGFEILLANDFDSEISKSYQKNFPNVHFVEGDIKDIDFKSEFNNSGQNFSSVDLIVGGPPCQGYSMANRKRLEEDNRNFLFKEFVRAIDFFEPKSFLIENVEGMKSENIKENGKNTGVIEVLTDYFKGRNYGIRLIHLKSEELGIPQFRRRILILGTNLSSKSNDLSLMKIGNLPKLFNNYESFKTKEQNQMKLFENDLQDPPTVYESISDLPELSAGEGNEKMYYISEPRNDYQKLMRTNSTEVRNHISTPHSAEALERMKLIKPGENFTSLPEHLKTKSVHSGAYGRLDPNGLTPTITTRFDTPSTGRVIHPFQNRTLTVREAARIQSFPDNFIFYGSRTSQGKQVGNAVPPMCAKAIGEMIIEEILL